MINAIVQVLLFSVIPFVWWSFSAKKEQPFLEWLGLHRPIIVDKGKYAIFYILSIVIVVMPNFALVFFYMDGSILASNQFAGLGLAGLIPALLYAMIQTGLSEELLFRGFLLKRLAKSFGFQVGNLLQSLVFGCIHGALLWMVLPFPIILLVVLSTGLAGYVMGWMNERVGGGSIVTSWSIHSLTNLMTACLSLFQILSF
ncbi:CPBP family intramembrane glutamic endopeptidase [Lysinibacillus sp. RSDA_15]|uniref:CPBP family intramembrane glutamic endopeptidase n=1 Tax=Lysinibacillus TaxID=400634 RepID=UPI00055E372E|nr:CPBP family intramembrane glutamic endopeptidase [Lysinibacillus sphaericus]QPA56135.1 CPBP family intramembrane metalloprotease [Lysinibacillus sphaericus]QTB24174.1 CPBP family intramembrane metalloprotease [Lysinibacillus sphaericus]